MLPHHSDHLRITAILASLNAFLSACDMGPAPRDRGSDALSAALPSRASGGTPVVESFSDFGGAPLDVALLPAASAERPWEGRGAVLLDTGDIALIDFSFGAVTIETGADATTLAAAPEFQMRGVPAPLLVAAGGAASDGAAFVYSAEREALLGAPMDALAPATNVIGLCPARASASYLDVVAVGLSEADVWRIQDRGEDALTTEPQGAAPEQSSICIERLQRAAAGVNIGDGDEDDAVTDSTRVTVEGGEVEIASLDDDSLLRVTLPGYAQPAFIQMEAALNTSDARRPGRIAASPANFGGSYAGGVVLVTSDDGSVSVLALDDVIEEARRAHLEVERPQTPLEQAQPPG